MGGTPRQDAAATMGGMDQARSRNDRPAASAAASRDALTMRVARRDEGALAELYDAYARRAFGLARRITSDDAAAEDVVQDAFLWVWEHADRVDHARGHAGSLILTIAHRRAVDFVRKRARAGESLDSNGATAPEPVDTETPAVLRQIEELSVMATVRDGIAALSREQREAVELAYYQGLTQEEIARERGMPLGTVKSRIRLAMRKLRAYLETEGTNEL